MRTNYFIKEKICDKYGLCGERNEMVNFQIREEGLETVHILS